jgi:hypothetical protein
LNFLRGETTMSYRARILGPKHGRGDYPELIMAGQIWNRHIVIMQPAPSQNTMTETRFELAGLSFCESNTTYLVRVNDNHYHACHFRNDVQCDTLARLLLPNGFYVEEMQGGRFNMFRALAHAWRRDSGWHDYVRDSLVIRIRRNWYEPWWAIQCRQAFPEHMNQRRFTNIESYAQCMRAPYYDGGDIPEFVAAGRMFGCHVIIMVHKAVKDPFLSITRITIDGLEVRRDNTLHFLRVADGRFHVLELVPNEGCVDVPRTINEVIVASAVSLTYQQTITMSREPEEASVAASTRVETRSMKKVKLG